MMEVICYLYTKLRWSHSSQKNWNGPLGCLSPTDPRERDPNRASKLLATASLGLWFDVKHLPRNPFLGTGCKTPRKCVSGVSKTRRPESVVNSWQEMTSENCKKQSTTVALMCTRAVCASPTRITYPDIQEQWTYQKVRTSIHQHW